LAALRCRRIADAARSAAIEAACKGDKRITYKRLGKNYGIVGNTNQAIKLAKGEFVGFLDHDDSLSPHALREIVAAIDQHPKVDFLYSDEDKISDDGSKRLCRSLNRIGRQHY
jgi:glycosyltransferase involved in cell wall biosynthesis